MTSKEIRYFDVHSDMLKQVLAEREKGRSQVIAKDFLPGMEASNIDFRVAGMKVDTDYLPEMGLRRALKLTNAMYQELAETPNIELATTSSQIRNARETDTYTFMLGLEGAAPYAGDIDLVDIFFRLGVRLVTLTHSRRNAVADGCFLTPHRSGTPSGITAFGADVLNRLQELGTVIDVSHLNVTGFWDVIELTEGPIVASHSNSRAVHDHPRNLTDDQIKAIADTGGIVGVTPLADFVADDGPTTAEFLAHLDHMVDLVGTDHVGFGFDFFEYLTPYYSDWDDDDPPYNGTVEGVGEDAEVQSINSRLRERDFQAQEIDRLTHRNFLRIFEEILP